MTQTPEGFGNTPTDPELFTHLEDVFRGTEERVAAVDQHDLGKEAQDIRETVSSVLRELGIPLEVLRFPLVREPSYSNGGHLAEDGQPLLLYAEDVSQLTRERPDLAEIIAHEIRELQLAERQQLEIERKRAEGNTDAQAALVARKAELDIEAERMEFWTAVALVHPFKTAGVAELRGNQCVWNAFNFRTRVATLRGIELECARLSRQIRGYSTDYFDRYEQAYGDDPGEKMFITSGRELLERNAVQLKRYGTFVRNVLEGRLTTDEPDPVMTIEERDFTLSDAQSRIKNLPGADPVLQTLQEKLSSIPESGWLIAASDIKPGQKCEIKIYHYNAGGFSVSRAVRDTSYGQHHATFEFSGQGSALTSVYFEPADGIEQPPTDYSARNPYYEIHSDGAQRQLRLDLLPMRALGSSIYVLGIYSDDIDRRLQTNGSPWMGLAAARVTASSEEAQQIITEILAAAGTSTSGIEFALTGLRERDVFAVLKKRTPEEQREFKALIESRMPPVEESYDDPWK